MVRLHELRHGLFQETWPKLVLFGGFRLEMSNGSLISTEGLAKSG